MQIHKDAAAKTRGDLASLEHLITPNLRIVSRWVVLRARASVLHRSRLVMITFDLSYKSRFFFLYKNLKRDTLLLKDICYGTSLWIINFYKIIVFEVEHVGLEETEANYRSQNQRSDVLQKTNGFHIKKKIRL